MAQNAQTPEDEEARKDLLATIAAGRELGPEMDQTLADRYIEQREKAKSRNVAPTPTTPQYAPVGQAGQPPQVGPSGGPPVVLAPIAVIVIVGIIVAAAVTQNWALLGLLWVAFIFLGPAIAFRRRNYRYSRRYYRRFGYYDDGFGPGGPPMMGGPGAPPPYGLPPAPPTYTPQAPYSPPAPTPAPTPTQPERPQNAPAQPLPPAPPVNPAG